MAREVGEEQAEAHAVEAEARLDDEGAIGGERQLERREQHHRARDQRRAVPQAARLEHERPAPGEPLEHAAERERGQHRGAERHVDHAEARLGHRVVGRLAVRRERDRVGERGRHRVAVRSHVRDLAPREPQARERGRRERGEEEPGKSVHVAVRE